MVMGRPLKFKSKEELQEKIDAFFLECDKKQDPYTITGLAMALNTSRETLCDYEEKDDYSDTVKAAKLKVQNYAEKMLFTAKPTGPIFALKNYGWTDKTVQEITGKDGGPIQHTVSVTDQEILQRYLNQNKESK